MNNILNFPLSTFVDKLIPKVSFARASNTPTAISGLLTEEIEQIRLMYVLRADTLNVVPGNDVTEIDVFYCKMKNDYYSLKPFLAMDQLLPRHTLFIIEYGESIDILMQYKEKKSDKWRFGDTEMLRNAELSIINCQLSIVGNNLDVVYASLLSQVSCLTAHSENEYKEQAEFRKQIASLEKQIASLQNNIRKEKQFSKQIEMNGEARSLKKQLAELKKKTQGDI